MKVSAKLTPGTMLGDLEIIAYAGEKSRRQRYECECPCGERFIAYKEHLMSGRTNRCPICARAKNIAGMTSGTWKAERRIGRSEGGDSIWQCRCQECGVVRFFEMSKFQRNKLPDCTHKTSDDGILMEP